MDKVRIELTIYFEKPFWVGIFEHREDDRLYAARFVFGGEPKDFEVEEFILKSFYDLRFSSHIEVEIKKETKNPKRRQREVSRLMRKRGIEKKAWLALEQQREQLKTERKKAAAKTKAEERQKKFEIRMEKKKRKKRGR